MGASSGCRTPRNYGVHGLFVQVCELDVRVVNPYRLNSEPRLPSPGIIAWIQGPTRSRTGRVVNAISTDE